MRLTKKFWLVLSLCLLLVTSELNAQPEKKNTRDTVYSVIYFGSTDCYYCNIEKNVTNISKMVTDIKSSYSQLKIKTIIVSMDKDISEGLKFIEKYNTKNWDEIAIGSFYKNELALTYLNKTKIPGVPHIVVVKHITLDSDQGVPVPQTADVIVDLVGATQIDEWLKNNYSFKKQ